MATKLVCDKCGCEIGPRVSTAGDRVIKHAWTEIDLCPSCMKRTELWLKTRPCDESTMFGMGLLAGWHRHAVYLAIIAVIIGVMWG